MWQIELICWVVVVGIERTAGPSSFGQFQREDILSDFMFLRQVEVYFCLSELLVDVESVGEEIEHHDVDCLEIL